VTLRFRVTPEEAARYESLAKRRQEKLSGLVRHLLQQEALDCQQADGEERARLIRGRGAIEADPANLNVTLDERGSVVVKASEDQVQRLVTQLKAKGMTTPVARREARKRLGLSG
jgi:hypothetical protein